MLEAVKAGLTRSRRILRRLPLVRRFVRGDDGAAAVEFALVLLPFLTIMFMIIETAIVFFAQQALETAVANSARLVMTGQAQTSGLNAASFKNTVCGQIIALFDCANKMYIDIQTYTSFGTIDTSVKFDTGGNPITSYAPGKAGDIVVVRLLYPWPIVVPLVRNYLADSASSSTRLLVATAAFRNEPY
jgi:Flp pilus assembly protein TadG